MRRIASFMLLVLLLSSVVVGSYGIYIYLRRNSGAVPSALLAGFTSLNPYTVLYAGAESDEACRQAYEHLKTTTGVCLIADSASSRYNPNDNVVYLTNRALQEDTVEAAHEFGHALDRCLYGEEVGYFSRQEAFARAYEADCIHMDRTFYTQDLFETTAYRNLAVSDILFAVFYEDTATTQTLVASYDAAGVPYWRHESEYMSGLEKRQTEVFANLFAIFLSDDAQAKRFVRTYLPNSVQEFQEALNRKVW